MKRCPHDEAQVTVTQVQSACVRSPSPFSAGAQGFRGQLLGYQNELEGIIALGLIANMQICLYGNAYVLQGCSSAALAQTKTDYDAFLGDAANLQAVRTALQDSKLSSELRKTLEIMQKTFLCYITEDPQATAMKVSHSLSNGLLLLQQTQSPLA